MKPNSPEPTFDLAPSVSSAARSYQSGAQGQDLAVTPQTTTSQDSPSYGMGEDFMVSGFTNRHCCFRDQEQFQTDDFYFVGGGCLNLL